MQSGKVKIGGQEMPLYYGMLARQEFVDFIEDGFLDFAKKHQISLSNDDEAELQRGKFTSRIGNIMRLAYIVVKDGHRHLKKEFSYSYEEFCDLLDTEENLEDAINEISAYVELVSPKETESEKNLKAPKSTGKK